MTPRKYSTPERFKAALLARLKHLAKEQGSVPARLRVRLVFERFLARVVQEFGDAVVLKGGFALELRLDQARSTKDVDLRVMGSPQGLLERLQEAGRIDLGDFMQFEVREDPDHPEMLNPGLEYEGFRFLVECKIAGKPFGGHFGADVALASTIVGALERVRCPDTLDFIGVPPPQVLLYPIATHIAEKLHAYTRPIENNTRVKDLPDLALLATTGPITARDLREGIQRTFDARATHRIPTTFPDPPASWQASYSRMVVEYALQWPTLAAVTAAARAFLEPVLSGAAPDTWSPSAWRWETAALDPSNQT